MVLFPLAHPYAHLLELIPIQNYSTRLRRSFTTLNSSNSDRDHMRSHHSRLQTSLPVKNSLTENLQLPRVGEESTILLSLTLQTMLKHTGGLLYTITSIFPY